MFHLLCIVAELQNAKSAKKELGTWLLGRPTVDKVVRELGLKWSIKRQQCLCDQVSIFLNLAININENFPNRDFFIGRFRF